MRLPPLKPGQVRFAHRRDANEKSIINALRWAGWRVRQLDSTRGEPDLLCCKGGRMVLLEVKSPGGRLTPAQKACHAELALAGITVHVVRDPRQALEAVGEAELAARLPTVSVRGPRPKRPRRAPARSASASEAPPGGQGTPGAASAAPRPSQRPRQLGLLATPNIRPPGGRHG
jgi:hypothetical protein